MARSAPQSVRYRNVRRCRNPAATTNAANNSNNTLFSAGIAGVSANTVIVQLAVIGPVV